MAEFVCNNRIKLSAIIIIVGFLLGLLDRHIENESSTLIQWVLFFIVLISVLYINFIHCVNDVEYADDEEYIGVGNVPNLQDRQVAELTKDSHPFHDFKKPKEYKTNKQEDGNGGLDNSKEKIYYVMQPVHVTQDEFDTKIKPQIDMADEKSKTQLDKAPAEPEIVLGYSLHSIPKKYRSMYGDICQFATVGGKKTEEELMAKIKVYGQPVKVDKPKDGAIAFEIASEPKLRIPEAGYFGIK